MIYFHSFTCFSQKLLEREKTNYRKCSIHEGAAARETESINSVFIHSSDETEIVLKVHSCYFLLLFKDLWFCYGA